MSSITDKQLEEIEQFAYLYLTREEIAVVTGTDVTDMKDPESKAYEALIKGRLKRKAEYNSAVIKLTKQLSSPAMAIEQKIAEATQLNDMKI